MGFAVDIRIIFSYPQYVRGIGYACFLDRRARFIILEPGIEVFSQPRPADRGFCFQEMFKLNSRDYIGWCGPLIPEELRDEVEVCLQDSWGAHHFAMLLDHASKRPQSPDSRINWHATS